MDWQKTIEKDTRACIRFCDVLFAVGFFAAIIIAPIIFFFSDYEITGIIVFVAGVIIGNRSYHAVQKYTKAFKEFGAGVRD